MALKKTQLSGQLTRSALLGVVLVGVLMGALVIARRGPAVLGNVTDAQPQVQPQALDLPAPKLMMVAAPRAAQAKSSKPATATPAVKPAAKPAAKTPAATKPTLVLASTGAPGMTSPVPAVADTLEVISITGCLQHDDGTFRLKDAAGDAPKERSWKSGFLKRTVPSVEIVDSANRLGLPTHVGQRVTVTGILLNKEMRARAVQRLGICS